MKRYLLILCLFLLCTLMIILGIFLLVTPSKQDGKSVNTLSTTSNNYIERMVIFADSGMNNANQMLVRDGIKEYCLSVSCLETYILGDLVYWDKVTDKVEEMNNKLVDVYSVLNMPINLVLGNHDYEFCLECILNIQTPYYIPSTYYTKEYEYSTVITLNTEDLDDTQLEWLEEQLNIESNKWKVIATHRPIITNESLHTGENWKNKDKLRELICNSADMIISGHSHAMEYIEIDNCKIKQVIVGSGGAELRDKTNDNLDVYFKQYGFGVIEFKESELTIDYFDTESNNIFQKVIRK